MNGKSFRRSAVIQQKSAAFFRASALIEIDTLAVYRGELPRRALALVLEWAALHRAELKHDWELTRDGRSPERIAPLE